MGQQGPNRTVREIENLLIPMADGTRLAARVFLPDDAETSPVPVILECVPYGKRLGTWERDELLHPAYAAHGYAGVRLDLRGSGRDAAIGGLGERCCLNCMSHGKVHCDPPPRLCN